MMPIRYTTTGAASETIVEASPSRQLVLTQLTAYKGSTFTINLSTDTSEGIKTIFQYEMTDGGTSVVKQPIILNGGEKLVSQSSTTGVNINATFEERSFI